MKRAAITLVALSLAASATAQTSGKQPVLVSIKRLSLDTALKAAQAAIEACRKAGVQVAVSVLDRGGNSQVVLRDVLAADLTLKVSHGKAYAAMSFVTPTSQLGQRFSTPFAPPSVGGVVIAAGGLPIQAGGELVGGIGVAGAPSGETDERCARAGIDAIAEELELGR
jgi:uncharacterized protein GlcG (DUF336 family)